jgi:hypothetical protein
MKKKIKAQFITNKMLNEEVEQKKYNSKKVKKKKNLTRSNPSLHAKSATWI